MTEEKNLNFIEAIIEEDLDNGKYAAIVTRFPPEPNGYLHIGHAKSICLNFGLAIKYNGTTNLRFDDTNPVTEETEYVESIKDDIKWLGFEWSKELYASDYFEELYQFAVSLIKKGFAYVDDSTSEEIASQKGTPTSPGTENEYRNRSVSENIILFNAMRNGEYRDGEKVLRAKVDMASPNMHMRDPLMYRIKHAHHHRTENNWCIYPMYDFAHGQSDSIENITHSLCTLEFVLHRELYDWFIEKLEIFPSHQFEFARLNMTYTVMSKRKLLELVNDGIVNGWDDPRMPTISGLRRRGYTPSGIRTFCDKIGVAKRDNLIDVSLLEFCIREELNKTAQRVMVVLDPLKLTITNYADDQVEELATENFPGNTEDVRNVPFSKELWVEREDFMEQPVKNWHRLSLGNKVRLKSAYIIECTDFLKDENGKVTQVFCRYLPESKSGSNTSGSQVKGTIHWVCAKHAATAEVRLYDRLFTTEDVSAAPQEFKELINPHSLQVIKEAFMEPFLGNAVKDTPYQFLRKGYFCLDKESAPGKLVFNRTVGLKDAWAKESKKG